MKLLSTTHGYECSGRRQLLPKERVAMAAKINDDCATLAPIIAEMAKKHGIKPRTVVRIAMAHIEGMK